MFHQPVKKAGNAILLILLAALAGMVALGFFWMKNADRRNADQIIAKIEDYRRQEGRLPDPDDHSLMKSLGFELGGVGWHPDYQPLEPASYRITLLKGFDGPYWIYESQSASWRFGYL